MTVHVFGVGAAKAYVWEHQTPAEIDQAAPVSGDKYVILDTTRNVRIYGISVLVIWTVQPSPLQIHITVDGVAIAFNQTDPMSAARHFALNSLAPGGGALSNAAADAKRQSFLLDGHSIKVEAETTGGTVQNLLAFVDYAILKKARNVINV